MDSERRYGRGIRFPLAPGPGLSSWVAGEDAVAQALRSVLLTEPGERIGRPTYGCGLRRFLFAPNSVATRTLIRQAVVEAIERDEPRVKLQDVEVRTDAREPTLLRIAIHYLLAGTPGPKSLVFPFYLDERTV